MKRHKRKRNKRILLCIIILIFSSLLIKYSLDFFIDAKGFYINTNYKGDGQIDVANQEGYHTIFKTPTKTYINYYQDDNAPWANLPYWEGTMADNGCGITAMSVLLSGYRINQNPAILRNQYYPVLKGNQIPDELFHTYYIKNTGFYYDSVHLSEEMILHSLSRDCPLLICVTGDHKNRWTTKSHYMVLLACDDEGNVYVSNPKGSVEKHTESAWYPLSQIAPYIAKIMYIIE